ncbi:glycosyltransferase [bacterium]|nr:glycosyltransferase [bacterium]MBQ6436182.1 glycosyltransferase [bacterium]
MKILMLTPYLPYPLLSGGQIRTYNLLKKMAKRHQITLFALIKNEEEKQYIKELEKYCYKVKVFKRTSKPFTLGNILRTAFSSYPFLVIRNHVRSVVDAIREELQSEHYDLIHAETFYMMPHLPKTDIPVMLVEQTIEYLGYESFAKGTKWQILRPFLQIDINKIKYWEKYYWQTCDSLVTMSEDDKKFIEGEIGAGSTPIDVVANGVDTAWFSEKKFAKRAEPTLLSVGTFKWLPNVEAVRFLVQKVWPLIKKERADAKLWVVGNAPTQEILRLASEDPQIEVSGRIEDIREAFGGAHILLAPVFSGKGTRYKILEAMASGTPIIATSTAVEGLGVVNRQEVIIADTAEQMASEALALLQDEALQQKLSVKGREFVHAHYDWDLIADQLDRIYQGVGKKST